jgi:hypothetical protein
MVRFCTVLYIFLAFQIRLKIKILLNCLLFQYLCLWQSSATAKRTDGMFC